MRKVVFTLILFVIFSCGIGCADTSTTPPFMTATPTMPPTVSATMPPLTMPPYGRTDRDSCGNHIRFAVSGFYPEPEKHLIYSHENGIMADGALMFMPLDEYVRWQEIPSVSRNQFLSASLTFDTYVDSFSCSTAIYRKADGGLEWLKDAGSLYDLPEGTYLICLTCSAAHQGVAYKFCYLMWVD